MKWSEHVFTNRQHTLVKRFRVCEFALRTVEVCQPIERKGHLGMPWSKLLLTDAQRPLVEGFRLRILPLLSVEFRQSMQRRGNREILRLSLLFPYADCLLIQWLSEGVQRTFAQVDACA